MLTRCESNEFAAMRSRSDEWHRSAQRRTTRHRDVTRVRQLRGGTHATRFACPRCAFPGPRKPAAWAEFDDGGDALSPDQIQRARAHTGTYARKVRHPRHASSPSQKSVTPVTRNG